LADGKNLLQLTAYEHQYTNLFEEEIQIGTRFENSPKYLRMIPKRQAAEHIITMQ